MLFSTRMKATIFRELSSFVTHTYNSISTLTISKTIGRGEKQQMQTLGR